MENYSILLDELDCLLSQGGLTGYWSLVQRNLDYLRQIVTEYDVGPERERATRHLRLYFKRGGKRSEDEMTFVNTLPHDVAHEILVPTNARRWLEEKIRKATKGPRKYQATGDSDPLDPLVNLFAGSKLSWKEWWEIINEPYG